MNNPHFQRLKARPPSHSLGRMMAGLPWIGLAGCGAIFIMMTNLSMATGVWQVMAGAALVLSVIVPTLAAAIAASSTAADIVNGYYPLVMLTPLSDRQLARGYFYAVLWRLRAGIWLWLLMVALVGAGSLWLSVMRALDLHPFSLLMLWALLLVQLAGWCWGLVAMGVAVGLRFQNPSSLGVIMPLITLLLMGTSAALTALPLLAETELTTGSALQLGVATLAPYAMLWVALHAADFSARRILVGSGGLI